jgi:hypothetical protein
MSGGLGRREPTDWAHVDKYPLAAAPTAAAPGSPVVLGINWYEAFDRPTLMADGRYWITSSSTLGQIRGGHAICVKPGTRVDNIGWWEFYDQGQEGACVGFSEARMMSLYNRTRYDGHWLYKQAQQVDNFEGDNYEGTEVRAGMDILRTLGPKRPTQSEPSAAAGISAYRWITGVDEVHRVIGMQLADQLNAVPLVNSWGRGYPHIVWMPDVVLARVLRENGEAVVATDR